MTVGLKNDRGELFDMTNGHFDMLVNCGASLLAGWAPSWRERCNIYLRDADDQNDDDFTYEVTGEADCKLFGRLVRIYARVLEERCTAFEKRKGHPVGNEDRELYGPRSLLRRDEIPFVISIAEFFERSAWVKRAH